MHELAAEQREAIEDERRVTDPPRRKGARPPAAVALDGKTRGRRMKNTAVLEAEIREVESHLALARSIGSDTKGDKLLAELRGLMNGVVAKGGERKAVIFTESVRTQAYLADILAAGGFAGRTVLLNGSNSDPTSAGHYRAWKELHAGTEAVSGSRDADMKAAIVDAFRGEEAEILIATESGAEGINLQFCSLLVKFDLPWNPQRVEQRIGRCHRYGQRLDVTVINFLNRRNRAEARVYALLRDKFGLFDGVFGASDGVLGAIEAGVEFEKAVLKIMQSCRTDAEIETGFRKLETELAGQIAADMEEVRRKVFASLDQGIVQRLKTRGDEVNRMLDDAERRLLLVARVELPRAHFHDGEGGRAFDLDGDTWTASWPLADRRGWPFFRLGDGQLASAVVERARSRDLPIRHVVFKAGALRSVGLPGYADVDLLRGRASWRRASLLTLQTQAEGDQPRQALVVGAVMDDGEIVEPEFVEHLLLTPGVDGGSCRIEPPHDRLAEIEGTHADLRVEQARKQNTQWLCQERDRLDAQAEDITRDTEELIKSLDAQIEATRKVLLSDSDRDPQGELVLKRSLSALRRKRDEVTFKTLSRQNDVRSQVDANLIKTKRSLVISPAHEPLFTIRWSVI